MQMLVHHENGVVDGFVLDLVVAVAVLAFDGLEVIELRKQAFAQVACADSDGVHLANDVDGFTQGVTAERYT